MPRFTVKASRGLLLTITFLVGCGENPFVPPPPPELIDSTPVRTSPVPGRIDPPTETDVTTSSVAAGRVIELILSRPPNGDQTFMAQILRQRAGKAQTSFRSFAPDPDHPRPVEWTVKAIEAATEMGASGLLVEVDPDRAIVEALARARSKGLAVLSLETPLPTVDGKPFTLLTYGSFPEAGRKIVKTMMDAALKFPDFRSTRILIIDNRAGGVYREARLESLTAPLRDLGQKWDIVSFDGTETDALRSLNKAITRPGPRVSVVLAQEDVGLFTAHRALLSRIEQNQPEFLIGGYFSYDGRSGHELLGKVIAFGDRAVSTFATRAFETITLMIDGKPVEDRVEVPIMVRSTETIFVPTAATKTASPVKP